MPPSPWRATAGSQPSASGPPIRRPATAISRSIASARSAAASPPRKFKEKPAPDVAASYILDGAHYWNSGIFCMRADVYLAELEAHQPALAAAAAAAWVDARERKVRLDPASHTIELGPDSFGALDDISVDYAVIERSQRVAMVPAQLRVERHRILARGQRADRAGCRQQPHRRARARARHAQHLHPERAPPDRRGRGRGPADRRHRGRAAGRACQPRPGREAHHRPPARRGPRGAEAAPHGASPMGQLHRAGGGRAPQDQAPVGEARRLHLAAAAPAPQRALGGGGGRSARDQGRRADHARARPVDLHSRRHQAPPGECRQPSR